MPGIREAFIAGVLAFDLGNPVNAESLVSGEHNQPITKLTEQQWDKLAQKSIDRAQHRIEIAESLVKPGPLDPKFIKDKMDEAINKSEANKTPQGDNLGDITEACPANSETGMNPEICNPDILKPM